MRLLGTARDKTTVLSFAVQGVHPHDVATSRASFAFYNTRSDVDALVAGIGSLQKVFA